MLMAVTKLIAKLSRVLKTALSNVDQANVCMNLMFVMDGLTAKMEMMKATART